MYFAQIDFFRRVLKVIVADQDFVDKQPGMWIQCDGISPKNIPGVGYSYDYDRNAFIEPKPYPSFILNETTCAYDPPTPMPSDGKEYIWDESTLSWKNISML